MQSKATTVEEYLAELPEERRAAVEAIRQTILKNLPKGYEEGMQYGMIGYYVPHSIYPAGYHCDPKQPLPRINLASQKNYISLYMMCIYGDEVNDQWFRKAWTDTGKKLDMGKSCIRIKRLEDVPLEVIAKAVKQVPVKKYIAVYEGTLDQTRKSNKAAKKKGVKKEAAKKKK